MTRADLCNAMSRAVHNRTCSQSHCISEDVLDALDAIRDATPDGPAELAEALGLRAEVCHADGRDCMDARTHRPWARIVRKEPTP